MATDKVVVDIITDTDKSTKSIAKYAAGVTAAVAVVAGAVKVSKELVAAYAVQEQAESSLTAAIQATGQQGNISTTAMKNYASSLQQVTLFGDEAILSGQAVLQSLANLDQDGLQKVTPHVLDFAQAMGVDVSTAMTLVGKTLGSSTNALARYGIEIDSTATKSEKLDQLTEALESKFGGMAEAAGDTATGDIEQLGNALGDLEEAGGRLIANFGNPFINWLTNVATGAADALNSLSDLQDSMNELRETGEVTGDLVSLNQQLADVTERLAGATQFETLNLLNLKSAIEDAISAENRRINNAKFLADASRQGIQDAQDAAAAEDRRRIVLEELEAIQQQRLSSEQKAINLLQEQIDYWAQFRDVEGVQSLLNDLIAERNELMTANIEVIEESTEAYQSLFDIEQAYNEQSYAEWKEIQEQKAAEDAQFKADELAREQALQQAKIGAVAGFFGGFSQLAGAGAEKSKELFNLQKGLAATEAGINSYLAFTQALTSVPFPFNIAAAGGVLASGLAQQASILSSTPAFALGGDFVTSGPQMIMVGDNPGGRERVQVTPESSPNINGPKGGKMVIEFKPDAAKKFFQVAIDNQEIIIP